MQPTKTPPHIVSGLHDYDMQQPTTYNDIKNGGITTVIVIAIFLIVLKCFQPKFTKPTIFGDTQIKEVLANCHVYEKDSMSCAKILESSYEKYQLLKYYKIYSEKHNWVLIDFNLPNVNGSTLCCILRQQKNDKKGLLLVLSKDENGKILPQQQKIDDCKEIYAHNNELTIIDTKGGKRIFYNENGKLRIN